MRARHMDGVAKCGLRLTDGDSVAMISRYLRIPTSIVTTGDPE